MFYKTGFLNTASVSIVFFFLDTKNNVHKLVYTVQVQRLHTIHIHKYLNTKFAKLCPFLAISPKLVFAKYCSIHVMILY